MARGSDPRLNAVGDAQLPDNAVGDAQLPDDVFDVTFDRAFGDEEESGDLAPALGRPGEGLSVFNSAAPQHSLEIAFIASVSGMVFVIGYHIIIHRIFRGTVHIRPGEHGYGRPAAFCRGRAWPCPLTEVL